MKAIVDGAIERGVAIEPILCEHGVTRAQVDDRDHWFPIALDIQVLNTAAERSGDRALGLHIGERSGIGSFGVLDYVIANAASFGAALDKAAHLSRLLSAFAWLELHVEGRIARVRRRFRESPVTYTQQSAELFMAGTAARFRRLLGSTWFPIEIRFRHRAPQRLDSHERILRAPLRFGAMVDEMVIEREQLAMPIPSADPELARLLDRHARSSLGRTGNDFVEQVRAAMIQQMQGERPAIRPLAKRLGMSARTLQRKLEVAGTSHQVLLDETRRAVALESIADRETSIVEVALLVGYSSLSSFYVAFRRWTGASPAEFRTRT